MCSVCDCAIVGLGCCATCAAAIFIVVIYFFFGVIFISIASTAKASVSLYQDLLTYDVSLFPNLCIVIGILFTFLTFLGLWGERKGPKTRTIYAIAQTVVVLLGLYIYIAAYPNESRLDTALYESLNSSAHAYAKGPHYGVENSTQDWDNLQIDLECCGVNNYQDWRLVFGQENDEKPPISCCLEGHRMLHCSSPVDYENPAESSKLIFVKGCLPKVRATILDSMRILHWFLIPILIFVGIGGIVTCCSCSVKEDTQMKVKQIGPILVRTKSKGKQDADGEKGTEDAKDERELERLNDETIA